MAPQTKSIETTLVHAGDKEGRIRGAVTLPIFQSAMYEYAGETDYNDIKYIRLNNTPNHEVLHRKIAAIENAEAALVTASGMAAISVSLLTVMSAGDHLLAQNCLYGGTHTLLTNDFPSLGLSYDFIDGRQPESWESKLRPTTKVIYVESMSNPLLEVPDLHAIVEFAKAHGLVTLIDNTFPTPYNFRPLDIGFDLSLHSATKYLNGHSDIVAGAVAGPAGLVERITHKLNHLGGSLDPHACFLLHRGMKTLALRMERHNQNALKIARFLEGHPAVTKVNYPGLESHPDHATAKSLFKGHSGMLSFELQNGVAAADRFMERTTIPLKAPSLGAIDTLLTRPVQTSHAGMTAQDREAIGITEALIRMSVGVEDADELIADFDQALGQG